MSAARLPLLMEEGVKNAVEKKKGGGCKLHPRNGREGPSSYTLLEGGKGREAGCQFQVGGGKRGPQQK